MQDLLTPQANACNKKMIPVPFSEQSLWKTYRRPVKPIILPTPVTANRTWHCGYLTRPSAKLLFVRKVKGFRGGPIYPNHPQGTA